MVTKPWLWPLGVSLVGGKGTGGMDDVGEAPQGLLASVALVGTVDQETTLSPDAPNLINQRVKAPLMTPRKTQLMQPPSTPRRKGHFPWLPGAILTTIFLSLIC